MSELITELKSEFEKTKNAIDERIEKAAEQAKMSGKVAEEVKGELQSLVKQYNEQSELTKKQQDHLDKLQAEIQKGGNRGQVEKSFSEFMAQGLKELFPEGMAQKDNKQRDIQLKAVGDMSTTSNLTGRVAEYDRLAGIRPTKPRLNHVRQFMNVTGTEKTQVEYVAQTGEEGAPTVLAEGGAKPQIDFDLEAKTAKAEKIVAKVVIPEELLEDIPELAAFISSRGIERLLIVEDTQILTGSGTSPNLEGLNANALTATGFGYTVGTSGVPQKWDVLGASVGKLAQNDHQATAIMLNPVDFHEMSLLRDSQGRYLAPIIWEGGIPFIHGVPMGLSNAITAGSFIMGDFNMGAEIKQRKELGIRFMDQTLAANNQVLVLIEERLALPIYYPNSFVYDTFADGITALTGV